MSFQGTMKLKTPLISILLMVSIFFSTSILAQQSGSIDVVKESRQILQMAEYIGVDYSEAVTNGEIANEDEFAEMQQFASLILQKSATLQTANKADFDLRQTSVVANARALQQAILEKYTIEKIQVLTQQIRQQLLALSPALLLPTQLLAQSQVQTLFADNCAACHGSTGEGNGPLAKSFSPSPTNFTETKRALNRSLLGLYDAISAGLDDTAMRAFTELNDQQRWSLAFYAGSLAFSQAANQHKQTDKKTIPKIALQSWINNNPVQLANDHGELTLDQIKQLGC